MEGPLTKSADRRLHGGFLTDGPMRPRVLHPVFTLLIIMRGLPVYAFPQVAVPQAVSLVDNKHKYESKDLT